LAKQDKYLVGLDIGSTKTCVIVGELTGDAPKFLGLGAAESKGLRKGLIVNLDAAVSSIRRAIDEAESASGVPVESVTLGVAGSHIKGVNSRGGISLGARQRDVNRDDVRRAVEAARGISIPGDREILHVLPQDFLLDNQNHLRDPIGMVGQKLEVNVHIVTSAIAATQNLVTAANRAGVIVSDTVLEPLASAESALTQDERELGCALLDIGGGSTDLIVYVSGMVRHAGSVPIGGDHFTNDLAVGLRTPIPEAERIKREFACASKDLVGEDVSIEIASVGDRPPRSIFAHMLNEIVEPRAHELLCMVRDEIKRAGLDKQIPAGIVLTGGASRLRGFPELAEKMFSLPVRLASPRALAGVPDRFLQPEYSASVGLLIYGAKARRNAAQKPSSFVSKFKAMFAGQ
jgi:cell division protein FtsA